MRVVRRIRLLSLVLLAWPALAGEYAVLASGATMLVERHESVGASVRLYANGGYVDVPASFVAGFKPDDRVKAAAPAPAPQKTPQQLVKEAAQRLGLPPELVDLVVRAESDYNPDAVSPKGAIGMMQLMPETARLLGADPHDPRQNVEAGTRYLVAMLERYHGSLAKALAAYNAGPGTVDRYHGVPPYRETVAYVERIVRQYQRLTAAAH